MPESLQTIRDFIRYGASRFNAAGLSFGHGYDNAIDEATHLVLHALHLPHDLSPVYAGARLTSRERAEVLDLLHKRIDQRIPAAYLTGEAWFCNLVFEVTPDVLIPRSPFAELIERGFEPRLGGRVPRRALDMCTGSGCIGIALAVNFPDTHVDLVDVSPAALAVAQRNVAHHGVEDRVACIESDLFAALADRRYDLIVSNPPYVSDQEVDALPAEYRHEPALGLRAGRDGLDIVLRMLRDAPAVLEPEGLMFVEVGDSDRRLLQVLPEVPFEWVEFQRGGQGVFVLDRAALLEAAPRIEALLAARSG